MLVAAVAISMLLSPLLLAAVDRWLAPRLGRSAARTTVSELDEPQEAPVIIAGFGRYGQIVGRLLYANGLSATVLEHDADQVETVRRFGWPVFYGDATRLDMLRMAGAERARVIVLAIDDVTQSIEAAKLVRQHFPQAAVVARARNVSHYYALRDLGVELIERETLDSALMSGRSVLELLGFQRHQARTLAMRFRAHTVEQLEILRPHAADTSRFIALSRQGREQLEQRFAQEREQRRNLPQARWHGSQDTPAEALAPARAAPTATSTASDGLEP
jgi:glutathione-regulated potassium-efflux system ancillary protein KefC